MSLLIAFILFVISFFVTYFFLAKGSLIFSLIIGLIITFIYFGVLDINVNWLKFIPSFLRGGN